MSLVKPVKLIIFDLDGTLVDSLGDLADAANFMLSHFGRPEVSLATVRDYVGEGARRLVEKALPGASEEELQEGLSLFLGYNAEHIAVKTLPFPGVPETLARLQRDGYLLTVASNKTEALCRKLLAALELEHFFSAVLGADSVSERKPSPQPILKLMADFSTSAAETAMVGDSINDIAAGKGAGVITVGCSYGYGDFREIAGADYRVAAFHELIELPPFR